eukprot:1753863-Pleurochrysis_carterae.AAC.1
MYDTDSCGLGDSAGAGAGARLHGGFCRGALSTKVIFHAIAVTRNLGSGARALREYVCDASPKWETVHRSVKLQMKGAREDSLLVTVKRA